MKKLLLITVIELCFIIPGVSQNYDLKRNINSCLGELDNFWRMKFSQKNMYWKAPKRYFYDKSNTINTDCGLIEGEPNVSYCSADNNIYGSMDLLNELSNQFNNGLVWFILSHEYGHAVQAQLNLDIKLSFDKELQADCIAGVFFNDMSKQRRVEKQDITDIHNFFKEYADDKRDIFTLITAKGSHGNSEQRYSAFESGYFTGSVNACLKEYNIANQTTDLVNGLIELFKPVDKN